MPDKIDYRPMRTAAVRLLHRLIAAPGPVCLSAEDRLLLIDLLTLIDAANHGVILPPMKRAAGAPPDLKIDTEFKNLLAAYYRRLKELRGNDPMVHVHRLADNWPLTRRKNNNAVTEAMLKNLIADDQEH